jgi:radical SAM protein with 4Fe4S-binding SPASM domain
VQDPPCRFNISLYGGSNETYERMCGRPAYHQVKENIRALREAGVMVSLNLSITPNNCGDLPQIYADAVELGVNVRASSYMYPSIRVHEECYGWGNRLSPEEAARCSVEWDLLRMSPEEFAQRAQSMEQLVNMQKEGCPIDEGEGIGCRAGVTSFWVSWDGRMMPCGMMTRPEVRPLEVGFDAAWEQLRAETARIRRPATCSGCAYKEVCGVCAAVCLTETGRFDGVPEYMCEKTRQTVRITKEAFAERKPT